MLPCFTQEKLPPCHSNNPLSSGPPPWHLHLSHTTHTHKKLTHTYAHEHAHNPPDTHPLITHRLLPSLCSRGLMGNLLKVLACAELEHGPIVFLDFERETIRFLFFWVIPFSLLPLLCFPHSIDLSWPLCHLYVLIYPFLPPQLYSSSPSLFLFWFPLQGLAFESHLASFLKGLIHTRHILLGADRCTMARWRHNKMTTIMLWSWLISYKKKPRRNKTECQSCVGFCCSEMMMANRSLSSSSTSSSPHPLLCDLLCVWPIRVWVSVRQIMCV